MSQPRAGSSFYKLIQQMLKELFVAEDRRLKKSIADILAAHNEVTKQPGNTGFLFNGEYYTVAGSLAAPSGAGSWANRHSFEAKEGLHESLTKKMEQHLKSASQVALDERAIGMMFYKLLDPCETLQDMRDSLPDCVANEISTLKVLKRERPPGWVLDNADSHAQFQELLPKIEFYWAARLMY